MRLILIRHCETLENATHILQGQNPGSLSDEGKEQAMEVARRLRGEKFDAVYSSDLDRAFQTAEILMKDRQGLPIITNSRLRERNFGIYEGKSLLRVLRQMKREKADFTTFNPQKGERFEDFRSRVKGFFEEVKAKHFGETVVLVTHYGFIKVLLECLSSQTGEKKIRNRIMNGSITILNIDRLGHVTIESITTN